MFGVAVVVTSASAQNRGELLYSTHCGACHTAQMHWRASRAVTDWTSLKAEVRKWQVVASLAWSEDDVLDVARYLNDSIYHFELMNSTSSSTRIYEER
jgi:mono/diheme cytochrome c family protein